MCNGTDPNPPRLIAGGAIAILHPLRPSSSSSDSLSSSTSSISSLSSSSSSTSTSPSTHSSPYALHLQNPTAQGYTIATLSTVDATGHPLATLGLRRGSFEVHSELEGLKRCRLVIQSTGDLSTPSSSCIATAPLHTISLQTSSLTPLSHLSSVSDRIELKLRMQEELDLGVSEKGVIGRKVQLVEFVETGNGNGARGEVGSGRVLMEGVLGWN